MRLATACALLLLAACGSSPTPVDLSRPGPLRAGAGETVLAVPVGHSHAGYLQSRRIGAPQPPDDPGSPFAELFPATRGMQSAPRAKAVVLDNGRSRLVLARIDAIFVTAELTGRVVELARERLDVDLAGELILTATHTHASAGRFSRSSLRARILAQEPEPQRHVLAHGIDTFSPESTDRIAGSVVEAIGAALGSLRPAALGVGVGENRTAARDRRCHDDWSTGKGFIDPAVTVIRIDEREGGAPIAVLFHYGMHGTLYDWDSRNLSVDAPGHAEYELEKRFDRPVVAMFLQGAAAGASPNADVADHHGSQAMQRVGWDLSRTVKDVWEGIRPEGEVVLRQAHRRVALGFSELGYREGEFPADGAMLCFFLDSTCREHAADPSAIDCLGKASVGGGKSETWLAAAQIGPLALLTLPGEPSTELSLLLKEKARELGFEQAAVLGYAQDHDGYLLLEDDWLSGGSETNITFWGWKEGRYLADRAAGLLRGLRDGKARGGGAPAPGPYEYEPYEPTESEEAPVVLTDIPSTVHRLDEIPFTFLGGDPALGTPEVRLEIRRGDAFEPWTVGWIPVTNLRGPELPTFHEAAPTFAEDPAARRRKHRWTVIYQPPADLPLGTWRLAARGEALPGGTFELASRPFELLPAELPVEGVVGRTGERLVVDATLLYPSRQPAYAGSTGNAGWQIGAFRLLDPRFGPPFVPVVSGGVGGSALVEGRELRLSFVERALEGDAPGRYAPGEGPGFHGELPAPPGPAVVTLPAGVLSDAWGNTNQAAELLE